VTEVDPVPLDRFVLVSRPVRGRFSISVGGQQRVLCPGQSVVLDAHSVYRMRWQDNCQLLTFRMDRVEFERTVADLRGLSDPAPVRFPLQPAPGRGATTAWDQVTRFLLRDVLPSDLLSTAPLVRTQVIRMVIASIVESHPILVRTPNSFAGQISSAAVHRATSFIDEAAAEPIRISDIAAAARLSPRALQEAFRRHIDMTPMAYLRSVRLQRAHAELQHGSADTGATVSAIAFRWGFTNLGRFAADYRREFGRSPSDVLRANSSAPGSPHQRP
jgi:AraC-like DNA-binding protein